MDVEAVKLTAAGAVRLLIQIRLGQLASMYNSLFNLYIQVVCIFKQLLVSVADKFLENPW